MKKLFFQSVLILLAGVALSSCSDIDNVCGIYATQLSDAVKSGDKAGMAEVDSLFRMHLAEDTAKADEWRESLADKAKDFDNDTVKIALRVIAEKPGKLGSEMIEELVEEMDYSSKELFLRSLGVTHYVYSSIGRNDDFLVFNSAYQKGIDALPVRKQMLIYSSIATPRILGEVLADDAIKAQGTPSADSTIVVVNQRIQELKKIYQKRDYEEMKTAFGRLILSTDAASIISSFDL